MTNPSSAFELRPMRTDEWDIVAELIHESTNSWYVASGKSPIFNGPTSDARLFCEVYEALDPGCCLLAVCPESGEIAGSCFYHPRPTHVSLGIMNVHSDFFGKGIAGSLLSWIIKFAEERQLPVRLVSSAHNLDSFSLYTKKGFVPFLSFQDLFLEVPKDGLNIDSPGSEGIREASIEDVADMVELERELVGIERAKDFSHFIENADGIWKTATYRDGAGSLLGFLSSVNHPGKPDDRTRGCPVGRSRDRFAGRSTRLFPRALPGLSPARRCRPCGSNRLFVGGEKLRDSFRPVSGRTAIHQGCDPAYLHARDGLRVTSSCGTSRAYRTSRASPCQKGRRYVRVREILPGPESQRSKYRVPYACAEELPCARVSWNWPGC